MIAASGIVDGTRDFIDQFGGPTARIPESGLSLPEAEPTGPFTGQNPLKSPTTTRSQKLQTLVNDRGDRTPRGEVARQDPPRRIEGFGRRQVQYF